MAAPTSLETAGDSCGFPAHHRGADHSYRSRVIGVFVEIRGEFAKEQRFCKYGVTLELLQCQNLDARRTLVLFYPGLSGGTLVTERETFLKTAF